MVTGQNLYKSLLAVNLMVASVNTHKAYYRTFNQRKTLHKISM
jgi:hypothetical protein